MKRYLVFKTKLSKFLAPTIAFSVLHTSLICCVLIPYFKDNGMLPLQISIIITSKRLLRLFCDALFGFIFDRFGAKVVFVLGRFLKLASYVLLFFFPNFYGFVFAMFLDGASYSSIYGKISSYIYNNMSIKRQIRLFPKAMSLYYLCNNISIAMMSFFASILLKKYNYDVLIYISIFTNLFSMVLLFKYVPKANNKIQKHFMVNSIKEIFTKLLELLKFSKNFRFLIILYGVNSFFAWQFHSISSMVLLDMKFSSLELAICGGILKTFMGLGAVFSLLFVKNGLSINRCSFLISLYLCFGCITAIVYNPYFFYIFCLVVVFFYTIIEVSIEKAFEFTSKSKIRGTAISSAMTICSFLAIISNISFGFISNYFGCKIGVICLLFVFFTIMTSVSYIFGINRRNLNC